MSKLTLKDALNKANISQLATALNSVALGNLLDRAAHKVAIAQTAAVTVVLSPPALMIQTLRVTAGAANPGNRQISDAGGTPSATVATISDDGSTLTFEGTVSAALITYIPGPAVGALAADYAPS